MPSSVMALDHSKGEDPIFSDAKMGWHTKTDPWKVDFAVHVLGTFDGSRDACYLP